MKNPNAPKPPTRMTAAEANRLARRDRNRIIIMSVGALILGSGYLISRFAQSKYEEQDVLEQPKIDAPVAEERVVTVEFDMPEQLEPIRDPPQQRAVINSQASLTKVYDYGRLFSEAQYRAMGVRLLDAATQAEVEADTDAHRVKPFRVRGELLAIAKREREGSYAPEMHGTLRTEDGRFAHFIVSDAPAEASVGSWVRVDGVFYKLFRKEVAEDWREGPLLLGREAIEAFAPIALASDLVVPGLAELTDDTFESTTGIPPAVEWGLMAKAQKSGESPDWESAPELTAEILGEMFQDGSAFRGKPFRIPVSRNVGSWVERAGENGLALDQVTRGWIGNFTWKGAVGVIRYSAPFANLTLQDWEDSARYVTARGFFLKNVNYEQQSGKPGRVPHFVMESVEIFTPEKDTSQAQLMWVVLGATVFLIALFWFLLVRDKKSAARLQEELVRRRRARRTQLAGGGEVDPSA
ncbi:MAG: hypothetical protein GY711_28515 [bacterium]|nr:hypothetical protein [bacterium]